MEAPNFHPVPKKAYEAVAGRTTLVRLPANDKDRSQDIRVSNEDQKNRGIHVKAEGNKTITVFGLNEDIHSADAFLALPCINYEQYAPRSYTYYIFSANANLPLSLHSRFLIVPCDNDTKIKITPSQTLTIPADFSSNGRAKTIGPNELLVKDGDILVHRLQTVMFQTTDDLTGTILESDKPITVIVGHQCGQVPEDKKACDILVEQVPPHITYGQKFFTTPLQTRRSGETYRVGSVSKKDGGVHINVTCTSEKPPWEQRLVVQNHSLKAGGFYEFSTNNVSENSQREFCCIESDSPVTVMQYAKGHGVDTKSGDPSMLYIPPVAQFLNSYTITTGQQVNSSTKFNNYVNYAIASQFFSNTSESRSNLLSNGTPFNLNGSYLPIYCSDLETICGYGAYSSIPAADNRFHYNQDKAGFFLFVSGIASEISYEYPAGFELEAIGSKFIINLMCTFY